MLPASFPSSPMLLPREARVRSQSPSLPSSPALPSRNVPAFPASMPQAVRNACLQVGAANFPVRLANVRPSTSSSVRTASPSGTCQSVAQVQKSRPPLGRMQQAAHRSLSPHSHFQRPAQISACSPLGDRVQTLQVTLAQPSNAPKPKVRSASPQMRRQDARRRVQQPANRSPERQGLRQSDLDLLVRCSPLFTNGASSTTGVPSTPTVKESTATLKSENLAQVDRARNKIQVNKMIMTQEDDPFTSLSQSTPVDRDLLRSQQDTESDRNQFLPDWRGRLEDRCQELTSQNGLQQSQDVKYKESISNLEKLLAAQSKEEAEQMTKLEEKWNAKVRFLKENWKAEEKFLKTQITCLEAQLTRSQQQPDVSVLGQDGSLMVQLQQQVKSLKAAENARIVESEEKVKRLTSQLEDLEACNEGTRIAHEKLLERQADEIKQLRLALEQKDKVIEVLKCKAHETVGEKVNVSSRPGAIFAVAEERRQLLLECQPPMQTRIFTT